MSRSLTSAIGDNGRNVWAFVDQPVDSTEAFDRLRDHRVDLIALLDVAHHAVVRDAQLAELGARLRHELVLPVGDDDLRAALAEMQRHALADALARPVMMTTLPLTPCISTASIFEVSVFEADAFVVADMRVTLSGPYARSP